MSNTIEERCMALVEELELGNISEIQSIKPLTGGVASDIAVVEFIDSKLCVKFALPKLKVAADWQAPVHRNAAEYAWLEFAAKKAPESAVKILGKSELQHGFAMEFISGADVYLWKTAMLSEEPIRGEARKVGDLLGRIHKASTDTDFNQSAFKNREDFYALRLEPYLIHTAEKYSDLKPKISQMVEKLYQSEITLIHGDASPKNIIFRNSNPVLLDAECATMGDPVFDPAFCLNHLLLKAVHLPALRSGLLQQISEFWHAYLPHVSWEESKQLEARICALLAMLFLARVDGKSPVEYLEKTEQDFVRQIAIPMILSPPENLTEFVTHIATELKELNE